MQMDSLGKDGKVIGPKDCRLVYVSDSDPGIKRIRRGSGFTYRNPNGTRVAAAALARIAALVIPPAWEEVWICCAAEGHLQATGRDARGRKQYRYHAGWSAMRNATKFGQMLAFGELLPQLRAVVRRDLAVRELTKQKVVALAVALLDECDLRVGNDAYARENNSFGLTTLRDKHVVAEGNELHFHFRGKSGKMHDVDLQDRRLARLVRQCRELPGQRLFQYRTEDGCLAALTSGDINQYLLELSANQFTAKDFRTWAGTVHAMTYLTDLAPRESESARKQQVVDTIKYVAEKLGNTTAVCRKYYVHPLLLEAVQEGDLHERTARSRAHKAWKGLAPAEIRVMKLLARGDK